MGNSSHSSSRSHSQSSDSKPTNHFTQEELHLKAKNFFTSTSTLTIPLPLPLHNQHQMTQNPNYKLEEEEEDEDEGMASPEFNYSNAEILSPRNEQFCSKKIFSNKMGFEREIDGDGKVKNFMEKLGSEDVRDRENVAFTLAHFIVAMAKTLGCNPKQYIQHICGTGIPGNMAAARDQIFALKFAG
jgi:hypothetical protein